MAPLSDLDKDGTIFVGKGSKPEVLTLAFANRHGLITGATGTGKTVTLQCGGGSFPRRVSVFAAESRVIFGIARWAKPRTVGRAAKALF